MSGPCESMPWNACVHRLDLGLYSHLKEFLGKGVRTQGSLQLKKSSVPETRLIRTASPTHYPLDHLGGLVVKVSASRVEDPGFESRLRQNFSGSSHTSDLKIGTPVATLPGAWHYRVSAGTGQPGVSIL